MNENKPELVQLTDAQKKAQRRRSIAIGVVLAAFAIIVYVGSWAKMGVAILDRPF
ncbi:hypothetical protein [Oricola thermophila]|uniref:hypothetical protein n=1 Tax=Oricola thermophila TaxID=2742145 RepID=UPI0018D6CCDF|nr:hypothetical protein [Oricola thermophila]